MPKLNGRVILSCIGAMDYIPVDFSDDKPLDMPWPEEIEDASAELEGLHDIDLVQPSEASCLSQSLRQAGC